MPENEVEAKDLSEAFALLEAHFCLAIVRRGLRTELLALRLRVLQVEEDLSLENALCMLEKITRRLSAKGQCAIVTSNRCWTMSMVLWSRRSEQIP